jgi:hypothetical protein
VVVVVEHVEGVGVVGDDAKEGRRFLSGQLLPLGHVGDEPDGLLKLLQSPRVDRVAPDEVITPGVLGPLRLTQPTN